MSRAIDLCTIGYEKRSLPEFIGLLEQALVGVVIDVRDVPWSHKPGFSRQALAAGLGARGIEYLHAGFAGNPKRLRSESRDLRDALEKYRGHLERNPGIVPELEALVGNFAARGLRACLVCFERDPKEC